jgi:hypothetical protein
VFNANIPSKAAIAARSITVVAIELPRFFGPRLA